MTDKPEHEESLWWLTLAPTIWALHFLASYLTAAIWCAKYSGEDRSIGGVPWAIGIYTAVALAGIAVSGWHGYRRYRYRGGGTPHDADTPEDRHRFLGFAALLLAALSGVATVWVGAVGMLFRSCY